MPNASSPELEQLMTPAEVATKFHVDVKTVTRWAQTGRLPLAGHTPGGHRRYRETDVQALFDAPPPQRGRPRQDPASARLRLAGKSTVSLRFTPAAGRTADGKVTVILGATGGGNAVTLEVTSLEWLDDLEEAIRGARAKGIVGGGMKPAVLA